MMNNRDDHLSQTHNVSSGRAGGTGFVRALIQYRNITIQNTLQHYNITPSGYMLQIALAKPCNVFFSHQCGEIFFVILK